MAAPNEVMAQIGAQGLRVLRGERPDPEMNGRSRLAEYGLEALAEPMPELTPHVRTLYRRSAHRCEG